MQMVEATLICRRRLQAASETITEVSDGIYDLEFDHEVVGLVALEDKYMHWPTFLEDTAEHYDNTVTRSLYWPAKMIGNLTAYCAEVYQSETYRTYCLSGHATAAEPQTGIKWNCHQFASRMRPELPWDLVPIPGYGALNIGSNPRADMKAVIASKATENTAPYGIVWERNVAQGWLHSLVGTNLDEQSLSVVGGLRPLCLTPNRELCRKYEGEIRPYVWN